MGEAHIDNDARFMKEWFKGAWVAVVFSLERKKGRISFFKDCAYFVAKSAGRASKKDGNSHRFVPLVV
jgi:hypothetical protein